MSVPKLRIPALEQELVINARAGIPTYISGPAGVGKSQLAHQFAKANNNMKVFELRANLYDPVDVRGGLKVVEQDDGTYRTRYGVPEDFPPTNMVEPCVLLIEELAQASKATMNALLQLLLDRSVGAYKLPINTIIIATGNRIIDRAGSNEIPTPVRNRLAQYELVVNTDDVVDHMFRNNYDPRIIAFLRYRPNLVQHDDMTQQVILSPRSWEFANKKLPYLTDKTMISSLSSVIGEGPAGEFVTYIEIENKLPKVEDIIRSPRTAKIPNDKEGHIQYAVAAMLPSKTNETTFGAISTYIKRFGQEFQITYMKDVINAKPEIKELPLFKEWSTELATNMYSTPALTPTPTIPGDNYGTRTFNA